jgi:hypothetical protein
MSDATIPQWSKEHGADYAIPAEITARLEAGTLFDCSYHNDACPSFGTPTDKGERLSLWVEHPDANLREYGDTAKRFMVTTGPACNEQRQFIETDDVLEALAKFDEIAAKPWRKGRRFVLHCGSEREEFPDMPDCPDDGSVNLWDRQENCPVFTIHAKYAQAICLESGDDAPFSKLEEFFNGLSNECLASEGLPVNRDSIDLSAIGDK